jgi:hypothetical protein
MHDVLNTHFHLLLNFVRFQCVCQFVALIRAHPGLEGMQLDAVKMCTDVSLIGSRDPPRMRTLFLCACEKGRVLEWMLAGEEAYWWLQAISLEQVRVGELPSVGKLLWGCGTFVDAFERASPVPYIWRGL